MESLKKCTEWKVLKNARKGKFQKMHGMESLKKYTELEVSKNARNGKFKRKLWILDSIQAKG